MINEVNDKKVTHLQYCKWVTAVMLSRIYQSNITNAAQ